jgi:hypothetical protein
VFGQSWAHQTGLGDVIPKEECRSALKSLYRYSFLPDVGPYRTKIDSTIKGGRWYAMPGEGGLVMCSWPKGGTEFAVGKGGDAWAAMYFNECMHGFEYQVAAHMMAEDMVTESLAICRSVHDRYQGHKRNPFNEIECGTHYARSMASHGVFLMACGFELDGPAGIIGFAPKLNQNNFEAAWIGPEGWGVYRQTTGDFLLGEIEVRYGRLEVEELRLPNSHGQVLQVKLDGEAIDAEKSVDGSTAKVRFGKRLKLEAGQTLSAMV